MDRKKITPTSGFGNNYLHNKSTSEDVSSPIPGIRRRNGPQSLRSPTAKRPISAPVAHQGWLHKQGSEGLMLWKKRWFVLCEYCLFYYKGPEEEKLLGSILLPSYTINICTPDEKINKKFAFKAEHANMRTYHFAADSRESMKQWINALTLASLLQDPNPETGELVLNLTGNPEVDRNVKSCQSMPLLNEGADDSDSGFHGFRTKDEPNQTLQNNFTAKAPVTNYYQSSNNSNNNNTFQTQTLPHTYQHPVPCGLPCISQQLQPQAQQQYGQMVLQKLRNSNGNQFVNQNYTHQHVYKQFPTSASNYVVNPVRNNVEQPIYANAFNKSKFSIDNIKYHENLPPDANYKPSTWYKINDRAKNKNSMEYDSNEPIYEAKSSESAQQIVRIDKSGLNYAFNLAQSPERRTPDTYGRSNKSKVDKDNGDYEDVYGGYFSQKSFDVNGVFQDNKQSLFNPSFAISENTSVVNDAKAHHPPRPHSADFLEHEVMKRSQQSPLNTSDIQHSKRNHPQRPKSSIDIVNPHDVTTGDNYFYSEEYYAAQMRQRAAYLHQSPQLQQQPINETTPVRSASREKCDDMKPEATEYPQVAKRQLQNFGHQSTLKKPSHRFNRDHANMRRSLREKNYEPIEWDFVNDNARLPIRVPREYQDFNAGTYNKPEGQACRINKKWKDQWFTRSASARFPSNRSTMFDNQEDNYINRISGHNLCEGERKREESMKRLLEWKQRMLQSPLTRKPSSTSSGSATQPDLSNYYKQQVSLDLTRECKKAGPRHSRQKDEKYQPHFRSKSSDGRRVAANVLRYNSYSSDDEDLDDKQMRRLCKSSNPIKASDSFGNVGLMNTSSYENISGNEMQEQSKNEWKALPPSNNNSTSNLLLSDGGADNELYSTKNNSNNVLELPVYKQDDTDFSDPSTKPVFTKRPKGILKTSNSTAQSLSWNEPLEANSPIDYGCADSKLSSKYVQWNSGNNSKQWNSKIDEHDIVKEFSYQYIKPDSNLQDNILQDVADEQREKSDIINNVQSMIKSFELANASLKEVLKMEKPLKISSLQATEAHISRLDSSRNDATYYETCPYDSENCKDIQNISALDAESYKGVPTRNKSVKDLLADFEKKSNQIKKENSRKQDAKARGVLSDTEILLYDTSSDIDQINKSSEEEEDEDEDHDLLQTIDLKNDYTITIKRKNDLTKKRRRRKTLKMSMYTEAMLAENEKSLRESDQSSVNEFLTVNEDEMHNKAMSTSPSPKLDVGLENIYLPMNPRKALLNSDNDDDTNPAIMQNLFANLSHEESSYVEMTQRGFTHSLLAPNRDDEKFNYTPHYEFVCVADNVMEPVYMEVHQFADKAENEPSKTDLHQTTNDDREPTMRSDLPDILNNLKSDSSDADDESSKDLDSIDTPRHPRFSLSDTFRPASYYLGASQTLMAEMQDSSDSDLVSPPPIPTSPPPLDDLDSLDLQESLEIRKKKSQVPVSSSSLTSEESNRTWTKDDNDLEASRSPIKCSPSKLLLNYKNSKTALDNSVKGEIMKLISPDEQIDEQLLKRRPVSNEIGEVLDILDQIKSSDARLREINEDMDQSLEDLPSKHLCGRDLYSKDLSYNSMYSNENVYPGDNFQKETPERSRLDNLFLKDQKKMTKTNSVSSLPSMRVSDTPTCHQHSSSFTGDAHYENVKSFSPLRDTCVMRMDDDYCASEKGATIASYNCQTPGKMKTLSPFLNVSPSFNSQLLLSHIQENSQYVSEESLKCSASSNYASPSNMNLPENVNTKSQLQLNVDAHGAPYYYSDLHATCDLNETIRLPIESNQLNDNSNIYKDYSLGDLNYGESNNYGIPNISAQKSMMNDIEDDRVMLKSKSFDNDEDFPDNFVKQTPDSQILPTSHRRSRSLEGLLDDGHTVHQTPSAKVMESNTSKRDACSNALSTNKKYTFEGDDPWEQDSLWRESLRTVSLRQAKSLDNLDNSKIGKLSGSRRNATSKNEDIPKTNLIGPECDPRQAVKVCDKLNANSAILSGEISSPLSVTESRMKKSFELDREKLRQWDLLSSACLLQEQQQASTGEPGREVTSCESTSSLGKARSFANDNKPVSNLLQQKTISDSGNETSDEWLLKPDMVYKNSIP